MDPKNWVAAQPSIIVDDEIGGDAPEEATRVYDLGARPSQGHGETYYGDEESGSSRGQLAPELVALVIAKNEVDGLLDKASDYCDTDLARQWLDYFRYELNKPHQEMPVLHPEAFDAMAIPGELKAAILSAGRQFLKATRDAVRAETAAKEVRRSRGGADHGQSHGAMMR